MTFTEWKNKWGYTWWFSSLFCVVLLLIWKTIYCCKVESFGEDVTFSPLWTRSWWAYGNGVNLPSRKVPLETSGCPYFWYFCILGFLVKHRGQLHGALSVNFYLAWKVFFVKARLQTKKWSEVNCFRLVFHSYLQIKVKLESASWFYDSIKISCLSRFWRLSSSMKLGPACNILAYYSNCAAYNRQPVCIIYFRSHITLQLLNRLGRTHVIKAY